MVSQTENEVKVQPSIETKTVRHLKNEENAQPTQNVNTKEERKRNRETTVARRRKAKCTPNLECVEKRKKKIRELEQKQREEKMDKNTPNMEQTNSDVKTESHIDIMNVQCVTDVDEIGEEGMS